MRYFFSFAVDMAINHQKISRYFCSSIFAIQFVLISVFLLQPFRAEAQTDTEFWFVVPEITIDHSYPGGVPAYFKLSSGDLPAEVTISMPAGDPAIFPDIVVNLGANDFQEVDVSCWIVDPCNPPDGTSSDVNLLENKPINASGINNFGILITSTAPITAYYEVSRGNNKDIWALKGKNALGTTFFTPFQNLERNDDSYNPAYPYSAIDVVATEDGTDVQFTLPPGISASYGNSGDNRPAGSTFTRTLNKGQTFSLFPRWRSDLSPERISQAAADRLVGTLVESVNGEPIAVTLNDDSYFHTSGTCRDVAGDQLIPANITGLEYIAIRTDLNNQDNLFVLATENGTQVTVYDENDNVVSTTPLNAHQQHHEPLPAGEPYYRIVADKPVYVWHVGGFGCEVGGAVLPPIDRCTGVPKVSFARTSTETFYIIMMVRKGAEDFFEFDGVERNDLFNPGDFIEVLNSDWSVARFGPFTTGEIDVGTHTMQNTEDIFHLGIVNGGSSSGCFYGYFSDYNEFDPTTLVVETGTSGGRVCVGETLQLYASGGTEYLWTPDTHLDDPTSATPVASNIGGSINYSVTVSGACNRDTTIDVGIQAAGPVDMLFEPDVYEACASPPSGGGTPAYEFTFTNNSVGDYSREWRWKLGPTGTSTTFASGNDDSTDPVNEVTLSLENDTDGILEYHITLFGGSDPPFCFDEYTQVVRVYPYIDVEAREQNGNYSGCQPLDLDFEANPIGHFTGATYKWDFGNGISSDQQNPNYSFYDTTPLGWVYREFYPKTTITDQWGVCSTEDSVKVSVYPYNEAGFLISDTLGCSPLNVSVQNSSLGGINSYDWSIDSDPPGHSVSDPPSSSDPYSRTLNNTTDAPINYNFSLIVANSYGCKDTLDRTVRVNPEIDVTIAPPDDIEICDSTMVSFTSSIVNPLLPNVGYSWIFGDGEVSQNANYNKLYRNFENGEVVYPVTLTAITEFGCSDTDMTSVEVSPRIEAQFSINKHEICSGEEVEFTYQRMGSITSYDFEFDGYTDDTWPTDAVANGTFTKEFINETGAPMDIKVTLTVENDNANCTKEIEKTITVNPSVSANFTSDFGSNTLGCNPLEVDFKNETVYTGDSPFNGSFEWDFGDGSSSLDANPNHTFINSDPDANTTFTVTLTSTSVHDCVDEATSDVDVKPNLKADFSLNPGSICSPSDVTFTPSSIGATNFFWDFDDLVPDEERDNNDPFTHTFTSSDPENTQSRIITLRVENGTGCYDEHTLPITLYPLVESGFSASDEIGCSDLEVTFTNNSNGEGLTYEWDFDDEQSSTSSSNTVTHTFTNRSSVDKIFNVRLTAKNSNGCTSYSIIPITVHPKVEADFSFTHDSVCTPFYVTLENASLNGDEFNWDFGHMDETAVTYDSEPFTQIFDNPTPNDILNYSITLEAQDNITGCSHDTSKTITVYPRVVANFDADVIEGCNPLTVEFANNSTGLGSYKWEFGDETSSSSTAPTKIFSHSDRENEKEFAVSLTSTNTNGCQDIKDTIITVYPLVEANFTINKAEGCTPLTIEIENTTVSPAYTYEWDFDDGQTSSEPQPLSVEIANTLDPLAIFSPNISLITRYINDESCMATHSEQVDVFPHIYPDFNATLEGCHPHTANFENTTNAYGGVNSPTYEWDFGNGSTSNDVSLPVTFTNSSFTQNSIYNVLLEATSIHGCTNSIDTMVSVYPVPRARMELIEDNTSCSPFEVEFVNMSEGTNLSYHYNFGDGDDTLTQGSEPMIHVFNNLTSNVKSFTTTLTAETEFGCTNQFEQTLWVNPQVVADFQFNPGAELCNPATVTMENSSLNSHHYDWDFDDSNISTSANPTHTFVNNTANDRVFDVSLIASSNYDCIDTLTLPLTVYSQPIADFSIYPPVQQYPNASFEFTNQTRPISEEWEYFWDFGDDQSGSTEMEPGTYTYETWGPPDAFKYFVTLRVQNENCSDEITHPLTLRPAQPEALFDVDNSADCPPLRVKFINASTYGNSYLWDFDDGNTSNEAEPEHVFWDEGYYNVSLTVEGDGGESTTYGLLRVYPLPKADFEVLPPVVVLPEGSASFYNLSSRASSYLWDFGDGAMSSVTNPTHYYEDLGTYEVQLIAYTDFNCTDTLIRDAAVVVEGAGKLRFPNAFVPSKNGPSGGQYNLDDAHKNEIFHPVHEGVIEYKLMIFNRWGQQIFQSDDVNVGWDGYYNGQLSAQDVYVWRAIGKFSDGSSFDKRGNVSLLR
ncbi:MAG: PKD domain-containing protein [Bacteroidales bacterium]